MRREEQAVRDDRIEDAYRDGMTVREVASAFGLSRQRVYEILSERGVRLERREPRRAAVLEPDADDVARMLRMRADGTSFRVIAVETGYPVERVRTAVQAASRDEVMEAIRRAG